MVLLLVFLVFISLNLVSATDMNDNSTNIVEDTNSTVENNIDYCQNNSSNLNQASTDTDLDDEFTVIIPSDDFDSFENYDVTVSDGNNSYNFKYYATSPVIVDSTGKPTTTNYSQEISSNNTLKIYSLNYYLIHNNLTNYIPVSNDSEFNDSVENLNDASDSQVPIYLALNQTTDSPSKTNVKISSSNLVGYNNEDEYFKVKLTDVNNKVISNQLIFFTINNKTYIVCTDSKGIGQIKIKLGPGKYEIRTTFIGNNKYNLKSNLNYITEKNITRKKSYLSGNNIYMIYKEPRTYQIKLKDSNGKAIANQSVKLSINKYTWVYLVKQQDWKYKYVKHVTYNLKTNDNGYAYIKNINFGSGFYNVTVSFNGNDYYLPSSARNNITVISYNVGNVAYKGESTSKYLISTSNCQKNNKKIINLAKKLTQGKSTVTEKANAIYNYVRYQVKYELYSNTRYGALKCLELKKGNCVDQAHLVVALCRAVGIPARYCHGPNHVWAQVLIKSKKMWIIADPTTQRAWGFGVWNIYPDYTTYANIGY